ncbi:hypothetical protein GBAR_LOCUS18483, partial [Geodia barretti]
MATGAGPEPADQGSHELGVKDLNVVFDALVPVAEKYEFFGIQIGVEMDEIEKIQMQYTDPNRCLLRILRIRLKQIPALTWNDIDRALRSRSVGESRLANAIKKDLPSHDSSLGTALDQEQPRKGSEKVERKPKSTKKEKHVREGQTQKVRNEQERDSDEEVREKEYQKTSEQTTGDEYASESETEVKSKTMKTKGSQSEYGRKEKQQQCGLGENDLKPLYEALYSVRTKYRYLCLQLGVDLPTIQGIEADHKNDDDRLLEVLFARLNGVPPLTWGDVVTALRSQTVGAHRL